jgi:hypothetical protein
MNSPFINQLSCLVQHGTLLRRIDNVLDSNRQIVELVHSDLTQDFQSTGATSLVHRHAQCPEGCPRRQAITTTGTDHGLSGKSRILRGKHPRHLPDRDGFLSFDSNLLFRQLFKRSKNWITIIGPSRRSSLYPRPSSLWGYLL